MNEWLTKKCFLLRGNLIISILKMASGKTLEELTEEDAKKLTLIVTVGDEGNEKVLFDGKEIGKIHCDFKEWQLVYTFTPLLNSEQEDKRSVARDDDSSNQAETKNKLYE